MDDLLDKLLRLGVASFIYNIYKNGFKAQCQAKNGIIFWHKNETSGAGEYAAYQVTKKSNSDCGYLIIHSDAMNSRFGEKAEAIRLDCQRRLSTVSGKVKIGHCRESFRPEVETEIHSGVKFSCLNP